MPDDPWWTTPPTSAPAGDTAESDPTVLSLPAVPPLSAVPPLPAAPPPTTRREARRRPSRPAAAPPPTRPVYSADGRALLTDMEQRQWAAFAHGGAVLGFLGWLPALVIHLALRERGPFAAQQAREALNFNITAILALLFAFTVRISMDLLGVWTPHPYLIWLVQFGFGVRAALVAWSGHPYRYPVSLRPVH